MQTANDIDRIFDRMFKRDLNNFLNMEAEIDNRREAVSDRAESIFAELPDFYTNPTTKYQYTNMDDAMDSITQSERISMAKALVSGDKLLAGEILYAALMRVCTHMAEMEA